MYLKNKTKYLNIRLTLDDLARIDDLALKFHITRSDAMRLMIRAAYDAFCTNNESKESKED